MKEPGKRSRLWDPQDICNLFKKNTVRPNCIISLHCILRFYEIENLDNII